MARQGRHVRGKEHFWRRMLREWRRSEQSVRAFCVQHGVSEPSFYFWRRAIEECDRSKPRSKAAKGRDHVVGNRSVARPPAFVPVTITAAAPLEIVLGQGRLLRVMPGFDAATLRQLLAVLGEEAPC
jgi:transposase-like protein